MPLVTGHEGISSDELRCGFCRRTDGREVSPWSTTGRRLKGLITLKDFVKSDLYPNASKDDQGRLRVGAAVGFGDAGSAPWRWSRKASTC